MSDPSNHPRPLIPDYVVPPQRGVHLGGVVTTVGIIVALVGIITAIAATAGVDDKMQILTGCMVAGFGITWVVLGQLIRLTQSRP